jgi:hypothetical protein
MDRSSGGARRWLLLSGASECTARDDDSSRQRELYAVSGAPIAAAIFGAILTESEISRLELRDNAAFSKETLTPPTASLAFSHDSRAEAFAIIARFGP